MNGPKEKYYQLINAKLNDPWLSNKIYWSILKTFYNGKKIPIIPPLFINNKFVTDFQEKANDHDGISVKMIKICADYIAHPLTLIFQNSLVVGIFTNDWKKADIVPIHKKNDKQII